MDKEDELRILKNFINCMTKTYRKRHTNCEIVGDILMARTSTAGRGSCFEKCIDLGIVPDSYELKED